MSQLTPGQRTLQQTLEGIRRDRKSGKRGPKRIAPKPEREQSVFSNCGPGGQRREHPNLTGTQWLFLLGEALRFLGIAWACRVSCEHWERDGCVSLYLQRPVLEEAGAQPIMLGALSGTMNLSTQPRMIGGGMWECYRIPVGAMNNRDKGAVLKAIMSPDRAAFVIASSVHLRAING